MGNEDYDQLKIKILKCPNYVLIPKNSPTKHSCCDICCEIVANCIEFYKENDANFKQKEEEANACGENPR